MACECSTHFNIKVVRQLAQCCLPPRASSEAGCAETEAEGRGSPVRVMGRNRARPFLNASPTPEHLNSGFMQMSCHLLRQGGCTALNRRTSPLWSGGFLRQKEIKMHARQALACNEGEKTSSGILCSRTCSWKCSWISLVGKVLGRVIFISLGKAPKHPNLSDL